MDLLKAKAFYSYRIIIYYNIGAHHMIGLHPKCLFKIYFSMENMNGIFFTSGAWLLYLIVAHLWFMAETYRDKSH